VKLRRLLIAPAVIALLALATTQAAAVQYGQPDTDNDYPWVGLMVAYDEDGQPLWRCTGSLISEDTFLTAGHCVGQDTEGNVPATAGIWFDVGPINTDPQYIANLDAGATDLCAGVTGYPCAGYDAYGTATPNPDWTGALTIPQTHDVGLVTDLTWYGDMPDSFGEVAPVGYLDDLAYENGKGNVEFTVVGYGLQLVKPVQLGEKTRFVATVSLINLKSALTDGWNLHYSSNPGQGHGGSGGTCFGDSGGPVIHDGLIVAVNSFVLNNNCKGAGFGYRVDTEFAQDFIFGS
jgi:hypothetical protein